MAVGAPVASTPAVAQRSLQANPRVLAFSSHTNSDAWLSSPSPGGDRHHMNEAPPALPTSQQQSLAPDLFDYRIPDQDAMSALCLHKAWVDLLGV